MPQPVAERVRGLDRLLQMPPIDPHVVDTADVELVSDWISSLGDAGTLP